MDSVERILETFQSKDVDNDWSFENTKPSDRGKWTHSYHRYPAKFIPQLVEKLLDEYTQQRKDNMRVNDPFFGCGTTLVTAISRGFIASGTDINPIAYLISKAKCTPIEPTLLQKRVNRFLAKVRTLTSDQTTLVGPDEVEPLIPERHMERIDYWFPKKNKLKLGKILRIINNEEDERIRDFLLVAFSHSLKNCSIWLQSSTKPTRDKNKNPSAPYSTLKRHLRKMIRGNNEFYRVLSREVRDTPERFLNIQVGDAREQPVNDESVDLIISSSPYVTSYEYADLHQLSTIWLDLAEEYRSIREEFIGTHFKSYQSKKLNSNIAIQIVNQMKEKDTRQAESIEAFFYDMDQVFKENYRILKSGGRCCYVIGNTTLRGVDILNAEVFSESLVKTGFVFDRLIKREIHSKLLPQTRDAKTGQFASNDDADTQAYPVEYIVIGKKEM